jgi:hypothetical protein
MHGQPVRIEAFVVCHGRVVVLMLVVVVVVGKMRRVASSS